jgi:hypothetical protein
MNIIFYKNEDFVQDCHDIFCLENLSQRAENISKIMRMIGWKWANAKNGYPTAEEIIVMIHNLYEDLIMSFGNVSFEEISSNYQFSISSGGFTLTLYYDFQKRELTGLEIIFDVWDAEVK